MYCRLRRMRWQDGFSELSGRVLEFPPITESDIRSRSPATIGTVVAAFWGLLTRSEGGQSG